jgi:hypothetical protein
MNQTPNPDGQAARRNGRRPHTRSHPDKSLLPHVYKDNVLCLHLPGEWTPAHLLGDTIVPWTAEGLMYYEMWLATDAEWLGGGHVR